MDSHTVSQSVNISGSAQRDELVRAITWKHAFWVASGVPALVLFSIGGIAALVGTPSWLCWPLSVIFGFIQAFTYAEITGLVPGKSGGASVYGAAARVRYGKIIAPLSLWSNWLAWTPVLTVGSSVAAGYILTSLFGSDAAIMSYELALLKLDVLKPGLEIRINAVSMIASVLLLGTFAVQHRGILGIARVQMMIGVVALTPLLLIGIVPFFTGDIVSSNLTPLIPLSGMWDRAGWTLFLGGIPGFWVERSKGSLAARFSRPRAHIFSRFGLSGEGSGAHIYTMQHVTRATLDKLFEALAGRNAFSRPPPV